MSAVFEPHNQAPEVEVANLRFSRQLMLWALRQWWHSARTGHCVAPLREAFERLGMAAALPAFARLLNMLQQHAPRPLSWQPPGALFVGDDEWQFLDALALLQRGDVHRVAMRWHMLWPEQVVDAALNAAQIVADALTNAGLTLDTPVLAACPGLPDPALSTRVH